MCTSNIVLSVVKKNHCACAHSAQEPLRQEDPSECAICQAEMRGYIWKWRFRRVQCRLCGKVKQERLEWISDNPFYTKRFAYFVGRKCRTMTVADVAKEVKLDGTR